MNVSDALLHDIRDIVIVAIVVAGLVAVLQPAALGVFVKPLMDAINKLVEALDKQLPPPPSNPPLG